MKKPVPTSYPMKDSYADARRNTTTNQKPTEQKAPDPRLTKLSSKKA